MTRFDIEERQLRRLEKRIRHITAFMRLMAVMGGSRRSRLGVIVRDMYVRQNRRMWEVLHPDGEPEDLARMERKGGKKDGKHGS